ncbi:hypothetical protein CEXT_500461 [Caerostris extrusa]|uniref:Uncharacterized protein n=1 Tax=Caerostris extrusa TaxID=172846 RepID=A0AAV4QT58_CAEEX|nr:hypothetical protein CEXT_500461 [Caerostris extrusa]
MPLDYRSGWTEKRACHPMMGGTLPARLKDHLSVTLSEGYEIRRETDALLYGARLTAVSVPSKVSRINISSLLARSF